MLNPYWKNVFNKDDFEKWDIIDSTSPPFYPKTYAAIDELLKKYYRSNGGMDLNNKFNTYQRKEILKKTMNELEKAVDYEKKKELDIWNQNQIRDESLDAKLQKQEDLFERAMFKTFIKKASLDDANLGRFWIDPSGKSHNVGESFEGTHMLWLWENMNILSKDEKDYLKELGKYRIDGGAGYFYRKGWIRISGDTVLMGSDKEMFNLAEFIKSHQNNDEIYSKFVVIVMTEQQFHERVRMSSIVDEYFNNKMVANSSIKKSNTISPIKKNYDYGEIPNYINRLKWFNKKERKKNRELNLNKI